MKAWRLHRFGLDHLKLDRVPVPVPGPGEILVRVSAVALNFRDQAIIRGVYDPAILQGGPLILASDAAGTVVQTGREVTRVRPGDRVASHLYSRWVDGSPRANEREFMLGGPLPGALAEYLVLPENGAVPAPAYLSDEEAATLPTAALTAWSALVGFVPRQAGDTVLVQGTGGVSLFAIQLAAAMGVKAIVTTSSDEKGEKAKQLGASHVINYITTPAWEDAVLELTGGKGGGPSARNGGRPKEPQPIHPGHPTGRTRQPHRFSGPAGGRVRLDPCALSTDALAGDDRRAAHRV